MSSEPIRDPIPERRRRRQREGTKMSFRARHFVVGLVRGRFDKTAGTITVARDPAACSLDVTIDTTSISTQNSARDVDLRGPAFFDVKSFPTMTYVGHGCRRSSANSWTVDGSLTIRGVTKVVPLRFTFNQIEIDAEALANTPTRGNNGSRGSHDRKPLTWSGNGLQE